jgi:phosphoglycerol transferase
VLLSLLAAAWSLELWNADLAVPFRYSSGDDTMFYLSLVKGLLDHGSYLVNHSLGAPVGQQLYDFPQGADNLNLLLPSLSAIWRSPAAINGFFLLTFALDSACAYFVMRRLGVSRAAAVVCASLFAVLPYHLFRSDSHLFLSAYYALPLAAYLFMRITAGEPLFERRGTPGRPAVKYATRRTAVTVGLCIVIGSTGLYYAVFGAVLVAAGAAAAAIARRGRGAVVAGIAAGALIVCTVALNLAPTFFYRASHGGDVLVKHSADAGDEFALSASYLVLPPLHDRIGPLRRLTERYAAHTPPHGYCEQCYESVGIVGDVGLGWLAIVAVAGLLGAGFAGRNRVRYSSAAAGVVVCLAIGATGGASSLARVFASSDIRAWNRLSVLIAFLALLTVGLLLDALRERWVRTAPVAIALAGVWLLGVVDQTSPYFVPPYRSDAGQYHADARLVNAIEHVLPNHASVFELPYVPYPEGYQPTFAPDQTLPYAPSVAFEYDMARGYIHSHRLSWSYGAIKGRPADWESQLAAKPVALAVTGAAAAGFDGLLIDPRGYPKAGDLVPRLSRWLVVQPLTSAPGGFAFFDLRPLRARLQAGNGAAVGELRAAVLRPLRLGCSPGRLTLENPGPAPRSATLVSGRVRLPITVPPGRTELRTARLGHPGATLIAPTLFEPVWQPFRQRGAPQDRAGILGPPCARVPIAPN